MVRVATARRKRDARLLWSDSLSAALAEEMWNGREGCETMRRGVILERRAERVRKDMFEKVNCVSGGLWVVAGSEESKGR